MLIRFIWEQSLNHETLPEHLYNLIFYVITQKMISLPIYGSNHKMQCRICLNEEGSFIIPCKCSGSIQNVHLQCLKEWINISGKTSCEICKGKFPKNLCKGKSPMRELVKDM